MSGETQTPWLPCPLCGAVRFYAQPQGEMLFLRITADGTVVLQRPATAEPNWQTTRLCCASCSWQGTVADVCTGAAGP